MGWYCNYVHDVVEQTAEKTQGRRLCTVKPSEVLFFRPLEAIKCPNYRLEGAGYTLQSVKKAKEVESHETVTIPFLV